MFSVTEQVIGSGTHHRLIVSDASKQNSLTIIPTFGALVEQITLNGRQLVRAVTSVSADGLKPVSVDHERDWLKGLETYPGMLLAPWVNRIKDGKFFWKSVSHNVPINEPGRNTALHGFVFNKIFTTSHVNTNQHKASVKLSYNNLKEDLPGYPWKFEFSVEYTLEPGNFLLHLEAKSLSGDQEFPFCCGWHPYFLGISENQSESVDSSIIEIPAGKKTVTDDRLIPTGETLEFPHYNGPIKNLTLDGAIQFTTPSTTRNGVGVIETVIRNSQNNFSTVLWQNIQEFPIVHIYTPDTRDAIALEPVSALPNCFNDKNPPTLTSQGWQGKCGVYVKQH